MMKKLFFFFCFFSFFFFSHSQMQRHKVALFAPLYLDSAFDAAGDYLPIKTFPKYFSPGLDFYMGAQAALDSLEKRGVPLEIFVYDTHSKTSITQQLTAPELANVEMIIGQTNLAETKVLAEAAQKKKVPFISTTLPNDAGVYNNPYFVVLNSTLQTHAEGIYKLLQRYFSKERIIVFRKPGTQEDQVKNYLLDYAKTTTSAPVNIKFVDVGNDFTAQTLAAQLDSTKKNICIAGSLDEAFGMKLAQTLAGMTKNYPLTLIGMPTWENLSFGKSTSSLEIIYSSPFYYPRTSPLEINLSNNYSATVSNRPSDLFFRGYETMLRFGLLLSDTKTDIASNLTRKGSYVFTQVEIEPVFKNKQTMTLDYFENKHLYFIRLFNNSRSLFSW